MTSLASASAMRPDAHCRPRQALDVGAPDLEQPQVALLAPGGQIGPVLPQGRNVTGRSGPLLPRRAVLLALLPYRRERAPSASSRSLVAARQSGQPRRVICSTRSWKIRHRRSFSWVSTELAADRSAAWLISSAAEER